MRLSVTRQAGFMRKHGIVLGTRHNDGRRIYVYMVNNLFAEIQYENDDPGNKVEGFVLIDGIDKLNRHLEKSTRPDLVK